MALSPKERFRRSDFAKGFNDIVDSAQMEAAFDAAMLEMMQRLPLASGPEDAAANDYRRQGAITFLAILKNLNTAIPERPTPDHNLNQT